MLVFFYTFHGLNTLFLRLLNFKNVYIFTSVNPEYKIFIHSVQYAEFRGSYDIVFEVPVFSKS